MEQYLTKEVRMPKPKSTRSKLLTSVAKICAYMECGKMDEAKQWATILQRDLISLGLLVDNARASVYDGLQGKVNN